MRTLKWDMNKEQGGHLFILAMIPIFLSALLPYIGIESLKGYMNIVTTTLGLISCWMLIWIFHRRPSTWKLPKKVLTLWVWLNTILSVALIIITIGTVF